MSIKSLNFLINIIAVIILLGVEIPVLAQHIESSKIQNESNEDNHADFKISLAQWSLHNSIFGSIKSIFPVFCCQYFITSLSKSFKVCFLVL